MATDNPGTVRGAIDSLVGGNGFSKDDSKSLKGVLTILQNRWGENPKDLKDAPKVKKEKEEKKKNRDELLKNVKKMADVFEAQFAWQLDKDKDAAARIKPEGGKPRVEPKETDEPDKKKKGLLDRAIKVIVDGIIKIIKTLVDVIMTVVKDVIKLIGTLGEAIGQFIGGLIGGVMKGIGAGLKALGGVPPQALLVFAAVLGILVAAFWGVVAVIKFGGKELREFVDIVGDQLVKVLNSLKGFNAGSVAALVLLGPGLVIFAQSLMIAGPALLALAAVSMIFEKLSGGKNLGEEVGSPIFNFIGGIVRAINKAMPDVNLVLNAAKIMGAIVVVVGSLVLIGMALTFLPAALPGLLAGAVALKIAQWAIVFILHTIDKIFVAGYSSIESISKMSMKTIFSAAGVMAAITVFNLSMIPAIATAIPLAAVGILAIAAAPLMIPAFIGVNMIMLAFRFFYNPSNKVFQIFEQLKVKPIFSAAGVMGAIAVFNLSMIVAVATAIPIAAMAPILVVAAIGAAISFGAVALILYSISLLFDPKLGIVQKFQSISIKEMFGLGGKLLAFGGFTVLLIAALGVLSVTLPIIVPLSLLVGLLMPIAIAGMAWILIQLTWLFSNKGPMDAFEKATAKFPMTALAKKFVSMAIIITSFVPMMAAMLVIIPMSAALKFIAMLASKFPLLGSGSPFDSVKWMLAQIRPILESEDLKKIMAIKLDPKNITDAGLTMAALVKVVSAISDVASSMNEGDGVVAGLKRFLFGSFKSKIAAVKKIIPELEPLIKDPQLQKLFKIPFDVEKENVDKIEGTFKAVAALIKAVDSILSMGGAWFGGPERDVAKLDGKIRAVVSLIGNKEGGISKLVGLDFSMFNSFRGINEEIGNSMTKTFEVINTIFNPDGALNSLSKGAIKKISENMAALDKISLAGLSRLATEINKFNGENGAQANVEVTHQVTGIKLQVDILGQIEVNTRNTNTLLMNLQPAGAAQPPMDTTVNPSFVWSSANNSR